MSVTVLVPAHNEAATIKHTIRSIFSQSVTPRKVAIICDNCNDATEHVVNMLRIKYKGLEIFTTVNNRHKKAGALNQALSTLETSLDEFILIMDADTVLGNTAIAEGLRYLTKNPKLGAVCSKAGVLQCSKEESVQSKLVWNLQKLEYGAFDSQRVETFSRIKVSHGMCTMYRLEALLAAEQYRKEHLSIDVGVYDITCITEDYDLTICIKSAGYEVTANLNMLAWTDVPLSWQELWSQRIRWFRGGVDCML